MYLNVHQVQKINSDEHNWLFGFSNGGKYKLNNKDVSNMSEDELADIRNKEIGFVFQTFNFCRELQQLIMFPTLVYAGYLEKRNEMAIKALKDDLFDRATHKPNELSGGQRQRYIARALVNDPSITLATNLL